MDTNDMWLTAGFSPMMRMKSEWSMSGTGCRLRVPNTAWLPANLFAQSCVPEPKNFRTPACSRKLPWLGPCRALNAPGLPL